VSRAYKALLDFRDLSVQPAFEVRLGSKGQQAIKGRPDRPGRKALQDRRGFEAFRDSMVRKAPREFRVLPGFKGMKDRAETRGRRGSQVPRDRLDPRGLPAPPDQLDPRGLQDRPVQPDRREVRVLKAFPGKRR
jgi:hypothetical protein